VIILANKPLIIAETAFSHEGSEEYLREMVRQLKGTKNVCIKFQILIDKIEFLTPINPIYSTIDKWLLKEEQWINIIQYAFELDVPVIVAVLDLKSLELVRSLKNYIHAIEIHPSCIPDIHLMSNIIEFCKTDKMQLIIGISGFSFEEITYLMEETLVSIDKELVLLMYGFQNYPTDINVLNLERMCLIQDFYGVSVGYADHTEYDNVIKNSIIHSVYGRGIRVIELHYVLEYGIERIDYITAYDAERIKELSENLHQLSIAWGKKETEMSIAECEYSERFRKVPLYGRDIQAGEILSPKDIIFKRDIGQSQYKIFDIDSMVGQWLKKSVYKGDLIKMSDLGDER